MGRVHVASAFLFATLVFSLPATAQQGTAQISGRVTDTQGAVLPGVSVVVRNEETGAARDLTSSVEGSYSAAQLTPGRYAVTAKLTGFRTMERTHLVLLVGTTLTIDLAMPVGGIEESVTVTGQSPLVDTTTATVGGNVGTAELSELPAMNRNYFSAVALRPGVQFSPSNQMGNDTIVANGQTSQNTNVSVDGGYNSDDALGTSSGAQVRTPLEAVQEFQVLTSMYDAEFGRASGAIVNAVSKSGTNQFKGVLFGYGASNKLTAADYFVERNHLTKPTTTKREWGGVIGGPIIKNKLHFFGSLERQIDNPNRSRVFESRPDQNFAIAEDRTDWNTLVRVDHQISNAHTWAVRWLREWAPQWNTIGNRQTPDSAQDETDLDQTAVGTLTSVIGDSRVNTVRIARTWEHWWHGNACFRAQGPNPDRAGFNFGGEADGRQSLCPPQLSYLAFLGQASTESQGPWDSNYQIEDDFSWFIPGKKGDHEVKVGARYNYTELERVSQINENGTFTINSNSPFNAADPRTYPERLSIRMGTFNELIKNHSVELYAQDKWKLGSRTTLSVGVRYDLEIIPLDESDNPLFGGAAKAPTDRNNIAPRIGFSRTFDDNGKSVLRGGYGIFYNRTILGAIDDVLEFSKFTTSNVINFPNASADPGPAAGRFPTDPLLVNGPVVNRALLNQMFPPGARVKNAGVVILDTPDREQPFAHQATIGYGRELTPTIAINADFVHTANRDMFLARNLNPMVRANTTRTGAITRLNAFGVLDEVYTERVWVMENAGYNDYDALNLSLEKRYANNWSGRISYSLSKSFGTAENQADKNTYQTQTSLNLDKAAGPSGVDRRHILAINGRLEVPKTHGATLAATFRYMTGSPFTIFNSNIDVDQNGELTDPSPAGTYSGSEPGAAVMTDVKNDGGKNGAIGPDYLQLDVRAGWRKRMRGEHALEVFLDIFNVTNRANFDNPSGDQRVTSTFLVLTNLRGGGGFPRQAQFGVRYAF
jgi:Carboxypeptidase regulatory-like domain/TonB dependent receptor